MIVLSGADAVLADRVLSPATIIIEDDQIVDVEAGARAPMDGALHVALDGHVIVPGFIDVHVHGVSGLDVLDGANDDALGRVALALRCAPVADPSATAKVARQLDEYFWGARTTFTVKIDWQLVTGFVRAALEAEGLS